MIPGGVLSPTLARFVEGQNDRVRRQACFQAVPVRSMALSVTTRANRRLVGTSVAGMAEVAFGVLGGDGGQRRAEGGMKAVHRPRRSLAQ
jgi:hypothetical protein